MSKINTDSIKFLKVREVKSPSRTVSTDAGIDFYVPKFSPGFVSELKSKNPDIWPPKNENYLVSSGNSLYITGSITGSSTLTMSGNSGSTKVEYKLEDENDTIFKFDEKEGKVYFVIPPHSKVNIPSGIKCRMAKADRALIAANKSGVASKHGLIFGAQVVDYAYMGEIHINVINTSTKIVRIYEDMKLIQFVETPIFLSTIEVVNNEEVSEDVFYKDFDTARGSKGFGSSDKI